MSLEQAAVVAEFQDDAAAVKALVVAAREGGFDHLAQRLRDERTEALERTRITAELTAAGVAVIDQPHWTDPATDLGRLRGSDDEPLSEAGHAGCPGHVAYLSTWWVEGEDGSDQLEHSVVYACTDPDAYGHRSWFSPSPTTQAKAEKTDEERAEATVERRRVLAHNKAWRSAEVVRREWLASFCARKTPPKGAVRFVVESLMRADRPLVAALDRRNTSAGELLGEPLALTDSTSDSRAQVVGLGLVLAAYEADTGTHSWRNPSPVTARYLQFLATHGYELAALRAFDAFPMTHHMECVALFRPS
jgi:ParB family chromosome partitioning protein